MVLRPIDEKDATDEVREYFRQLKEAFKIPFVPVFFRYIGNFPLYCDYLTDQLVPLLKNEKFTKLTGEQCDMTREILLEYFSKGGITREFLKKLKNSAAFYHFDKDLKHIYANNAKMVFIFIAIREAVKGWAIAAKKMTARVEYGQKEVRVEGNLPETLVYEDFIRSDMASSQKDTDWLSTKSNELAHSTQHGLTTSLLPSYMQLVKSEFERLVKTERFLYFRVEMEKIILAKLDHLPQKIESPINIVLELTQKYPTFAELLHLLSDQFPTTAMHRFLFSGWILP